MASNIPIKFVGLDTAQGNGGSTWDTIAQIEAGTTQPFWVVAMSVSTTTSSASASYGVRLQRQGADIGSSVTTPGDLNLSWGFDGTTRVGSIGIAGGDEPTAWAGAGDAVLAEEFRTVGATCYLRFEPGRLVVPAGSWLGLQVYDTEQAGTGLTYSGGIYIAYHADS